MQDHLHPSVTSSKLKKTKDNHVKVVCRVKPLIDTQQCFDMQIDKQIGEISISQPRQETVKIFTFNRIFTEEPQSEFVTELCNPILEKALIQKQGSLIFSYGVTNSGKTYTILGNNEQPGILPYLIEKMGKDHEVLVSAIELYNDEFFSLTNKDKLSPKEQNGFMDFTQCMISEPITPANMADKIKKFIANRTQNQTRLNPKSSRSHAIFKIEAGGVVIGVVDLAGSERTHKIFASIDQTSNINKSLLCLGRCIKALNEQPDKQPAAIPYRESKLTKVLIEFFAAKADVMMIANINQDQVSFHENMKVLDYAVMAKDIRHCNGEFHPKTYCKSKTKKVDVFEALYKSAPRNTHNKVLKTSKSESKDLGIGLLSSSCRSMEIEDQNKKFAKALKAKQLELFLQKYNSSQDTEDMLQRRLEESEDTFDQMKLQQIKNSQYHSPISEVPNKQESDLIPDQIKNKMKEELRKLLEEERLANMVDQDTRITTSFKKTTGEKDIDSPFFATPFKDTDDNECKDDKSLIKKVAEAAYNSTKKVLTNSVMSLKKIMSNRKKQCPKKHRLAIMDYSATYEGIFSFENHEKSQSSPQKFQQKVDAPESTPGQRINNESQNKDTLNTNEDSDDDSDQENELQHHRVSEVSVRNCTAIIQQKYDDKNPQKEQHEEDQKASVKHEEEAVEISEDLGGKGSKVSKKLKTKRGGRIKGGGNDRAKRVAETRKLAAKMCRQNSRTPLKSRLRKRNKH